MRKETILLSLFFGTLLLGCADNFFPDLEEYYPEEDWAIISENLDLPPIPYIYLNKSNAGIARDRPHTFERKATIGRVLFYDKSLSADGMVSCASCHKQELAFSDDVSFSIGAHGNLTTRNSYPIGSFRSLAAEYYNDDQTTPGLFWDNRAENVEAQMIETLANPNEMGINLKELEDIVKSKPYYQSLFKLAETPEMALEINSKNILDCLQDFLRTIDSQGSKFDKAVNKDFDFMYSPDPQSFTPSEQNGKLLFGNNCNQCHVVTRARDAEGKFIFSRVMANNGLDKEYMDNGAGTRVEYKDSSAYDGLFKVPDLRNIALTAPYMHDGRFASLDDVIDHYSEGVQDHKNISKHLKNESGAAIKFNFTAQEKKDLENFLHTLTDHDFIKEAKWSDPFKR